MKNRTSVLLGWILAALCILGFFLPWARFAPESAGQNLLSLANSLAAGEDDVISSYVWMRRDEMKAAMKDPAGGQSGYQLFMRASSDKNTQENAVARAWLHALWHGENPGMQVRWIILLPILALVGAGALSPAKPPNRLLLGLAAALFLAYGWMRWKMNQAYTDRLLLQLDWNLGLWLCLYSGALLGILLIIRALLPARVRF
jgi:hypothetical protein